MTDHQPQPQPPLHPRARPSPVSTLALQPPPDSPSPWRSTLAQPSSPSPTLAHPSHTKPPRSTLAFSPTLTAIAPLVYPSHRAHPRQPHPPSSILATAPNLASLAPSSTLPTASTLASLASAHAALPLRLRPRPRLPPSTSRPHSIVTTLSLSSFANRCVWRSCCPLCWPTSLGKRLLSPPNPPISSSFTASVKLCEKYSREMNTEEFVRRDLLVYCLDIDSG
ncbi:hypothetical protein Fmac_021884 [Flemingia macrophylla]|uniref:Uncharacterized protein n=1 Tax=Flemingia macrophylla TaxID=520843 RepID=A0ABD1LYE6_9FABA